MTSRHGRTYKVVAIAVILGAVRCGNSPVESAGGPAAAATQSKAQAKKPNACLLVDREDMERLAKGKVTLLHNIEAAEQTNCEVYLEGKADRAVIVLEVHWTGGKALGRAEKPAAGSQTRPSAGTPADIASLTGSGVVADDAYYSDAMAWVVKGDVRLKFTMPGLGADDMQKNFVPLARKALSRL